MATVAVQLRLVMRRYINPDASARVEIAGPHDGDFTGPHPGAEVYLFSDTVDGITSFVSATGIKAEKQLTPEEIKEIETEERSLPAIDDEYRTLATVFAKNVKPSEDIARFLATATLKSLTDKFSWSLPSRTQSTKTLADFLKTLHREQPNKEDLSKLLDETTTALQTPNSPLKYSRSPKSWWIRRRWAPRLTVFEGRPNTPLGSVVGWFVAPP